jgi:hypothetical protein
LKGNAPNSLKELSFREAMFAYTHLEKARVEKKYKDGEKKFLMDEHGNKIDFAVDNTYRVND